MGESKKKPFKKTTKKTKTIKNAEGAIILENTGMIQTLLYLVDHPEGLQKVDLRNILNNSSSTAMRVHRYLFTAGLISNLPSLNKTLFGLTVKGKDIALFLKGIDYFIDNKKNIDRQFFNDIFDIVKKELFLLSPNEIINLQSFFDLLIEIIEEWTHEDIRYRKGDIIKDMLKIEYYPNYFQYLNLYKIGEDEYEILNQYRIDSSGYYGLSIFDKYNKDIQLNKDKRIEIYKEIIQYTQEHWHIRLELNYPDRKIKKLVDISKSIEKEQDIAK